MKQETPTPDENNLMSITLPLNKIIPIKEKNRTKLSRTLKWTRTLYPAIWRNYTSELPDLEELSNYGNSIEVASVLLHYIV